MACYKELVIPVNTGAATTYNHRLLIDMQCQSSMADHNNVSLLVTGADYVATITQASVANYAGLVAFQSAVKTLLTDSTIDSLTLTPGAAITEIEIAAN